MLWVLCVCVCVCFHISYCENIYQTFENWIKNIKKKKTVTLNLDKIMNVRKKVSICREGNHMGVCEGGSVLRSILFHSNKIPMGIGINPLNDCDSPTCWKENRREWKKKRKRKIKQWIEMTIDDHKVPNVSFTYHSSSNMRLESASTKTNDCPHPRVFHLARCDTIGVNRNMCEWPTFVHHEGNI